MLCRLRDPWLPAIAAGAAAVVLLSAIVCIAQPATQPASRPATPTADPRIAQAIRQLADGDYRVRERAEKTLWAAGRDAEPALKRAAAHPNPEVARRAREVLSNIELGLTPDMSRSIIGLLAAYRTGDAAVRQQAIDALGQQGATGARLLLKIRGQAVNPAEVEQITKLFWRSGREMAIALVVDGDAPNARRVLAAAVETAEQDTALAMHYAALLAASGGLDEAIADTSARLERLRADAANAAGKPLGPPADAAALRARLDDRRAIRHASWDLARTARLLTLLRRAAGDLTGAGDAAALADSPPLLRDILIEAGDWPALARLADEDLDDRVNAETLSFGLAFHRLAGDEAGAAKYAGRLRAIADRQPEAMWDVAEGLFLNGEVDLGLEVIARGNDLAMAIEFATHRLAFERVGPFVAAARGRDVSNLRQVEAAAARAAWMAGDAQTAAASLDGLARDCERRRDFNGFVAVIDAGAEIGLTERVRWYVVSALQLVAAQPALLIGQPAHNAAAAAMPPGADRADPLRNLFAKARLNDPAAAAAWWSLLRERLPKQPAGRTFETIRAIDERRIEQRELVAMCDASATDAMKRPPEARDAQLELIAATLNAFGQREASAKRYEQLWRLADRSSPARATAALCKLASFDADAGHWRRSAEGYFDAWTRDRGDAVPLYLSGLALVQAGEKSLGRQRMEQAHVLPLADENRRHALYQLLLERKLTDEAKRERELILRTSTFLSWPRSDALRRAGDEAYAAGEAGRAADLWEHAFLDNNSSSTGFVEPFANLAMPALVRRTRAVALIRAGQVDAGLKEADVSLAMSPGDADTLIDVVAALEAANHKAEADALYARESARYARLSSEHPQSGPLHNLCAWAAARCGRDLDAALAHARAAVQIQPRNAAAMDTLAETHFRLRQFPQAIAAMEKSVELAPDDASYKQKLERFRQAAAGAGGAGGGHQAAPATKPAGK